MKNLLGIKNINSHPERSEESQVNVCHYEEQSDVVISLNNAIATPSARNDKNNCYSELDSESINLMDNKELALIDSGSESGMTGGKCVVTPPEFLGSQSSLRNSTLPVQGGRKFAKAGFTLTGATHVGLPPVIVKAGFTLAEVLITLGIIGVVAAMTIPNLMSNIRAQQYTKKFKKVISTLANAGRMSNELYGFDYAGISDSCSANSSSDHPEYKQSVCALLNGTLTGATFLFGLDKLPNYNFISSTFDGVDSFNNYRDRLPIYILSDGTIVILSGYQSNNPKPCTFNLAMNTASGYQADDGVYGNGCYAMIDVNGIALPNKETTCSVGSNFNTNSNREKRCVVNNKDVNDIFFVAFYDSMTEPWTTAGWSVLQNSK